MVGGGCGEGKGRIDGMKVNLKGRWKRGVPEGVRISAPGTLRNEFPPGKGGAMNESLKGTWISARGFSPGNMGPTEIPR